MITYRYASRGFLQDEIARIATELKSAWEIIRVLQENVKQNIGSAVTMPKPKMAEIWTKVQKCCHNNIVRRKQNNLVTTSTSNRFSPLENDVVVVLGDINDIGTNMNQAIRNLVGFAKECQHTNG